MTEKEFTASLENSVFIPLDTYEDYVAKAVIVDRVTRVVSNNEGSFGLSREDTKTLEIILGIERGKSNDGE